MSGKSLAIFGTEFDAVDDEQRDAISKKPLQVQEQVATDEKGRRRFHGAFTGGFSAGYFNTVGTKHGWVPQTFKSTRADRAEKTKQNAEDFMDDEDLGEFGIASRRIRTAVDFVDQLALPGDKRRLAWERDTGKLSAEASRLADLIRPVSDSIGMRLLKKMGWRAGQGIGPKMSKAAIGRQNNDERRARGETEEQIEKAVREMGEMAPGFQFAPDDVDPYYFTAKTDDHGLGYVGLQSSGVLEQKNYGKKSSTLKTTAKTKGITGQAFGVGAFEDEDADIYTTDDLSQYDYSINESGSSYQEKKADVLGADFIEAKKVLHSRKFYAAPKLPSDFRPQHKSTTIKLTHMPSTVGSRMTPIERARYLGEGTASVMSLVRDEDRVRLERTVRSRWDQTEAMTSNRQQPQTSTNVTPAPLPFDDEPMKQRRYKEYVKYLRRGLNMPQPIDLTEWEWEREMVEFQSELSPDLRAVLPEVKARLLPLARPEVSASFAHLLKSKFTTGATLNDDDAEKAIVKKDDDKVQAVRMKMFGAMTRERYEWHPNKQLSKRFNIPEPYPDSNVDGVPQFQRETKKESIYDMSILPTTALELANRRVVEKLVDVPTCDVKEEEDTAADVEQQRPPIDLFQAIFASDQESSGESSDDDDGGGGGGENEKFQSINVSMQPTTSTNGDSAPVESLPTVMELIVLDEPQTSAVKVEIQEEEYGPAVPARIDSPTLPSFSVVARHRSKHHRSSKKKKSKKSKKDKKKEPEDDRAHHHHHHRKKKDRKKSSSDNGSIILSSS